MKRVLFLIGSAVMALPCFVAPNAQAESIPWSISATAIGASGSSDVISNGYSGVPGSTVGVGMWSNPTTNGTNSGNVSLISLQPYLTSNNYIGDINGEFGGSSSHYQLNLLLRDQASGASGNVTFSGYFSGELSLDGGAVSDPLRNSFVGPTTQTLKLGSDLYTVTIGPAVLPYTIVQYSDSPYSTSGTISASISVQPATSATPEPSSLLLACLAVPPLGLARWLRRRKSVANNA